jgi:hypothetical protein
MAVEVAMGFLTLPLTILIIMFPGSTSAQALTDFSRFASAQGEEIAVVDMFGAERLGRVVAATETSVTVGFGAGTHTFDRADVLKADRLQDGTRDGVVKGMLIGALVGWAVANEVGTTAGGFAVGVSVYGSIGYLLDRANTNRAALYRK